MSNRRSVVSECVFVFDPKSLDQQRAVREWDAGKAELLFLCGAAGCGKTYTALGLALTEILKRRTKQRLVISRPVVECGPRLGYLPGTVEEKLAPYFTPIQSVLLKLAHKLPLADIVSFEPLAFMRGDTFDDAILVLDEAQNATLHELKLFLSRCGKNSRVIVCGDPDQTDVKPNNRHDFVTDLDWLIDRLWEQPGVAVVDFSEEVTFRNPRLTQWLKRLRLPD